ncbi:hypothetical protein GGX14DRAFT_632286 [Mycena pura]|uniref:F-box domain-containing protein n=1 Tax=Mycena pura TaxID=153505 RepID=A0AAD6VCQ1_9AGAR|nr:hypothetical protein GGX14DRAFT_632286 [Mycena pura]
MPDTQQLLDQVPRCPPDEVLSRIFAHIQNSAESAHPELLIASVARHWREAALKTPSLWTTIHIRHDRHISVLGDILTRSQTLPLSIRIRLDAFRYRFCTEYTEAIDILRSHISRWRSLCIIATNPVLHTIRTLIRDLPMPALEHLELVQADTGQIQHLGPFVFEPSVFRSLRLERTMMYAADASMLAGLTHVVLVESSLAMLDENRLLSLEYPTLEARTPRMTSLTHLVLDASNPTTDGHPTYSPAFCPRNLTSVSFARLVAPSLDGVQALSRFYGTALMAPSLRDIAIADIGDHALVMLLSVVRTRRFPPLRRLALAGIDTAGIDDAVIAAFAGGVEELVLARLDAAPLLLRLVDPAVWPTLERIELDGAEIPRPSRLNLYFSESGSSLRLPRLKPRLQHHFDTLRNVHKRRPALAGTPAGALPRFAGTPAGALPRFAGTIKSEVAARRNEAAVSNRRAAALTRRAAQQRWRGEA